MLAIEYYRMLKEKYKNEVHKSKYIYIYTNDGVVENVLFRFRKGNGKKGYLFIDDMPKEKLMLANDGKKLQNVIHYIGSFSLTSTLNLHVHIHYITKQRNTSKKLLKNSFQNINVFH